VDPSAPTAREQLPLSQSPLLGAGLTNMGELLGDNSRATAVLALQRTSGNRAVARPLARVRTLKEFKRDPHDTNSAIRDWVAEEVVQGLPSPASILPSEPPAARGWESRTTIVIDHYIDQAAAELGPSATRYQVLKTAREHLTRLRNDRSLVGSSESLMLRNAERYLWGRHAVELFGARGHGYPGLIANPYGGKVENFLYNLSKVITRPLNAALHALGAESRAGQVISGQGAADKPQSAIGGASWFNWGLEHYASERAALDQPGSPMLPPGSPPLEIPVRIGLPFTFTIP
jgi:hypothetical protein